MDMVYLVRRADTGCTPVAIVFTRDDAEAARDVLGGASIELVPASRAFEERARSMGHVNADGVRLGRA